MTEPGQQLDLQVVLRALRRRWRLIALITVLAGGLALVVSLALPDRYKASADLLFGQADPAPNIDPNEPLPDRSQAPERVAATNLALASLDRVATRVETKLKTDLTAKELRDRVELDPQGQADIVTITATGDTPRQAAQIANAFANEVVAARRDAAQQKIQRVIDAINAQAGRHAGHRRTRRRAAPPRGAARGRAPARGGRGRDCGSGRPAAREELAEAPS